MRKLMRRHYGGERGFTMLELLIVIIILGILAAILVPRLMSMRKAGDVAAANTELASVESAVVAYYANNPGIPAGGTNGASYSLLNPPSGQTPYISHAAKYYNYTFTSGDNVVDNPTGTAPQSIIGSLTWCSTAHQWYKP